ncbi:unannotated protein [freshwater metagenome]|uniref:Unannotated protein n=1 Tax=freshwater metagenome TaxID=449393 RepID=A0A6J6PYR2_9ZZZZ
MLAALTPMNISAPAKLSARVPVMLFGLQLSINHWRIGSVVLVDLLITPFVSKATIFVAPLSMSKRAIAVPAAPAPLIIIRQSARFFFTSLSEFRSAASTTIAVPCWSSWKTGMSSSSRRRRSTSKQRGAEISSRLIPPYTGAIS